MRGVAGSVVARLAVGGVRVWRRGGTAAASRVHHSWAVGRCPCLLRVHMLCVLELCAFVLGVWCTCAAFV